MDYLADDRPVTEAEFTRRACDPWASAVVEACAGSGKTWLLVGRIVRALLAGAAAGEILAITFTRRAAQEMRSRLMADLQMLTLADDDAVITWLRSRGLPSAQARAEIGAARRLYERVATAPVPLAIETFHGWFWQLVCGAPLGAGVPYAPSLLETVDRVRTDAWLHFTARLLRPEHAAERAAWERLLDDIGEDSARRLLLKFLDRRAEWRSFAADDEAAAVERALAPLRTVGEHDPRAEVRAADFVEAMETLAELWASRLGALKTAREAVERARQWVAAPLADPAADFRAACLLLLTKEEQTPIKWLRPEQAAGRLVGAAEVDRYAQAHGLVVGRLAEIAAELRTRRALRLNEAALPCGRLLVDAYQRLKAQQQALDFTDLEWHAHRLLADADHAAYLQVRLDARYRHILVDEFQDTNPLQWQVLKSWLAGYGELEDGTADERPRVFVVGDPKQSIYRFRRAEPRVFDAARDLLQRDFGAVHLRTNVTRRNARTLTEVLNLSLPANPLYQRQSTRAAGEGAFVLLPRVPPSPAPPAGGDRLRDVLTTPRAERDSDTRYREGRVLANEILHWVGKLRVPEGEGERPARFADVLLLVRRRTHLAEYERALRDGGVPYVSDRRGGLLATLEADDLTALLGFLTTPSADLRLAHALRSPIFGAGDDDLIRIAAAPGATWWQRLQSLAAAALVGAAPARAAAAGAAPAGRPSAAAAMPAPVSAASVTTAPVTTAALTMAPATAAAATPAAAPVAVGGAVPDAEGAVAASGGRPGAEDRAADETTLSRARRLLAGWLDAARILPVHDLLDRIYFEGDLRRRYAAAVPATLHTQVQANLDAFIELALAIDSGRYPSLPRFIDELVGLKRHAPEEAPDEGMADAGDAVRVMTIHGAKGLEAEIVAIADAHARPAAEAESVLVVWPPQAPAPEHVSLVARGEQARDEARGGWFADEDAQREQEDWNLLYVAATRARQVLIVSGSEPAKGTLADTWYTRLQAAEALSLGAAAAQTLPPAASMRELSDFRPAPLPAGGRLAEAPESEPQRLGRAWHALLEQGAGADARAIARAHRLTSAQGDLAAAAAAKVRQRAPQFFTAAARAEVELVDAGGALLRVDRLVEGDDALWIVDFKWRVGPAERPAYEAQVRRYAQVLRAIRSDKPVRLALVTAAGEVIEVEG